MQLRKRVISFALSFVLLFSMVPLAQALPSDTVEGTESIENLEETEVAEEDSSGVSPESIVDEKAGVDYMPGEVIVVFKEDVSSDEVIEIFEETDTVNEAALGESSLISDKVVVAELNESASVSESIEELNDNDLVDYAQPNYLYSLAEVEGDDLSSADINTYQATIINDSLRANQWSLLTADMYNAWSLVESEHEVSVAVIDTGVNTEHPDLKNNIVGGTYYDATGKGQTGDLHGHGTHVAGIIAAQANNEIGVAGVSYNAGIIPICAGYYERSSALSKYIMNTEFLCNAYEYLFSDDDGNGETIAEETNLKVINMSLGGYEKDIALEESVDMACDEGVLTVCAAGNDSVDVPIYPGSFDACINVSALKQGTNILNDKFDNTYSNFGNSINISAPGSSIYSTLTSGTYGNLSGTSMASPFVSGIAALLFTANSDADPTSVREALLSSAVDLGDVGWDKYYGAGEVNPCAAILSIAPEAELSCGEFVYDSTAQKPSVQITFEGETLTEDLDYSISYQNNINAGTAKVVIKGTGAWKGTLIKKFTIIPADISEASVVVADQSYSGSALTPAPSVALTLGGSTTTTLVSGADYSLSYSNNTKVTNSAKVTITGKGNFKGTVSKAFKIEGAAVTYSAHMQSVGWIGSSSSKDAVYNGAISGIPGQNLRMEALSINLVNNTGKSGTLVYSTQVQNVGWQTDKETVSTGLGDGTSSGQVVGTTGKSLRVEALKISLKGDLAKEYNVYYRAYLQGVGWMGWAKNGADAVGSIGLSKRIEGIQVYLSKSSTKPADNFQSAKIVSSGYPCAIDATKTGLNGDVSYNAMVHVQNKGNINYSSVNGTTLLGTSGQSLRLEALKLSLVNQSESGGISYSTHIQNIGWQSTRSSNQLSGTQGKSLRLEAVRISLTGEMKSKYDIYYRTHVQKIGWTGWAKNGQSCGSAGYSYRMEAIQIVIVEKGTTAPGLNTGYFKQK